MTDQSTQAENFFSDLLSKDLPPTFSWIEPSVLPHNGKLLFAGVAKCGKTFVAIEMLRALATGGKLFDSNSLHCPKEARVLYLEQELGKEELKDRAVPAFRDVNSEKIHDNIWFVSRNPYLALDTAEGFNRIRSLIDQTQPNVLMLDPLAEFHSQNENDMQAMSRVCLRLNYLLYIYEELGLSVIVSHHFGKPPKDEQSLSNYRPLDPNNFRGSSRLKDWPDTLMSLSPVKRYHQPYRWHTIAASFLCRRGGKEPPPMLLAINKENDRRVRFEREAKETDVSPMNTWVGR